ncbi:hypothetical protein A3770_15p74200 [Chloropicon primus]|uniref:ShKT domain-containing protein n=1 Tax=Chloropicon primus TaxID=1764295 RepID=A0A5B8MZ62_9CHLO|nr:hypothetical protein A3770_15p74200 [Chloropicon primus]|eukprot:QDZ24902.1 hypothetical protein A3770_15p74200 [Chloropicon primus]
MSMRKMRLLWKGAGLGARILCVVQGERGREGPQHLREGGETLPATIWMHQGHFRDSLYRAEAGVCEDKHKNCKSWAAKGECQTKASSVKLHCRLSCGICHKCQEGDVLCERKYRFAGAQA